MVFSFDAFTFHTGHFLCFRMYQKRFSCRTQDLLCPLKAHSEFRERLGDQWKSSRGIMRSQYVCDVLLFLSSILYVSSQFRVLPHIFLCKVCKESHSSLGCGRKQVLLNLPSLELSNAHQRWVREHVVLTCACVSWPLQRRHLAACCV